MAFILFFSIVMVVYTAVNYYIYTRGQQAIAGIPGLKPWFAVFFWLVVAVYPIGRFLEKTHPGLLTDAMVWAGSFWLAFMVYLLMLVLVIDLIRLSNFIFPWFPESITKNPGNTARWAFVFSLIATTLIVAGGYFNAAHPRIRQLSIHIDKPAGEMEGLTAVLMSDIHLGTIIRNGRLNQITEKVESLKPDIILLAGDILDEDLEPVLRHNMGETLRRLRAPLGVYGIMGNHEHIGGATEACQYLTGHGITLLRDSVIKINNAFYLIGREDRDKARFGGNPRVSLDSLISEVDTRLPMILLDHQPYYLEKAAAAGIDLQLSGHTHHGQLWPFNFITRAIYTISQGYGLIDGMHAYVSNGVGTWGPPVRTGNRPEIVYLNISFKNH